ncbi:MAG: hypothetical protein ACOCUO_02060 [archaeon]
MTKNTPRDRVWVYVLDQAFKVGAESVRSPQVAEAAGVSERTARDALKTMPFTDEYRIPDGRVRYDIDYSFFET